MNIVWFETKAQLKSCISWMLSLLAALFVLMGAIYPVFERSFDNVLRVVSGFPPEFTAAFGFNVADMFSVGGFYGFAFAYIGLVGGIMAVALSVAIFSRERRAKATDFLLTKPASRAKIFACKLAAGIGLLLAVNLIYIAACFAVLYPALADTTQLVWAALALLFTQLVFFAMGAWYALFAKKVRSVSGVATAFGFGAFILSALVSILEDDKIRYIAPLKYFDPTALFQNGAFDAEYAIMGACVSILCLAAAFILFCKRDAHAV